VIKTICAGCGTDIHRVPNDQDINSEFCGKCNQEYYESLVPTITPEQLAELEKLKYATHVGHANGRMGESDELCCGPCQTYLKAKRQFHNREHNLTAKGIDDPVPMWVRTLRAFLKDIDAGKATGNTGDIDQLRHHLRTYDRHQMVTTGGKS
jgi:hypothetical protein